MGTAVPSRRYTVDSERAFLGSTSRASSEGAPDTSVGWVAEAADAYADLAERSIGEEAEESPRRLAGGDGRGANARDGAATAESSTGAHEAATCIVTMVVRE